MKYYDNKDNALRFITPSTIRYAWGNLNQVTANNNNFDPSKKKLTTLKCTPPSLDMLSQKVNIENFHKKKHVHESALRIQMGKLRNEVSRLKNSCQEWGTLNHENDKTIQQLSQENLRLRQKLSYLQKKLEAVQSTLD